MASETDAQRLARLDREASRFGARLPGRATARKKYFDELEDQAKAEAETKKKQPEDKNGKQ
jgi:hypothetical protein